MAIPTQLEQLHRGHWGLFSVNFDLTTNEGCGLYTEHWVRYAQSFGYSKVGHLKKNPGQTQYNGHANDAFLYREAASVENPLYQAVDIIAAAESTDPNNPPRINWGVDIPRYKDSDWLSEPNGGSQPNLNPNPTVPWSGYNENDSKTLRQQLAYDYGRRPQAADFDVVVWAARVFHSQYMGPDGKPLGFEGAMKKHRPEWCSALGIPVDNHWLGWI